MHYTWHLSASLCALLYHRTISNGKKSQLFFVTNSSHHFALTLSLLTNFSKPRSSFYFFPRPDLSFFLKTYCFYLYILYIYFCEVYIFVFVKQITSLTNVPEGPIIEVTSKSVRMKKPRDAAKQCSTRFAEPTGKIRKNSLAKESVLDETL